MKVYEVEMRRTSYITMTVEADSFGEAEELAYKDVEARGDSNYANWEVESIEEVTGETE